MTLPTNVFKRPPLKWCRIEEKAERLLDECRAFEGKDRLPLPVPVDRWIEHPLGYTFGVEDLTRFGPGVLGCVFIEEREILVSDAIRNDGRFRFTCAHELGHMALHRKVAATFHERGSLEPGSLVEVEREADRFAVGFLMPAVEIVLQLDEIVSDHALDLAQTLHVVTGESPESRQLWAQLLVPELCRRFDVSRQALAYRLAEIRFRDGRSLLPKQIASQFVRHGSAPSADAAPRP
jgi:Zn-dependent peptidase ImmA (M78 family)